MKKTSDTTLFLISFFINILTSYLLGFKFKKYLTGILSDEIYYQLIVFISLSIPLLIKKLDHTQRKIRFSYNYKQLQKVAHTIDKNKIGEEERAMLEIVTNKDMQTESKIRDVFEEMQNQTRRGE